MEPDIIADIPIPVPKDPAIVEEIGNPVIASIEELERSIFSNNKARSNLLSVLDEIDFAE